MIVKLFKDLQGALSVGLPFGSSDRRVSQVEQEVRMSERGTVLAPAGIVRGVVRPSEHLSIASLPVSDAGDSVAAACGPTGRRGAQGLLADIFGRLGDVAAAGAAGAALGWATCSSAAGAA